MPWSQFFFFKILLIHERHKERRRDKGRGRSRLPAGSPMWNLIPGPQDHDLSWRQLLNHWATQAPCPRVNIKSNYQGHIFVLKNEYKKKWIQHCPVLIIRDFSRLLNCKFYNTLKNHINVQHPQYFWISIYLLDKHFLKRKIKS